MHRKDSHSYAEVSTGTGERKRTNNGDRSEHIIFQSPRQKATRVCCWRVMLLENQIHARGSIPSLLLLQELQSLCSALHVHDLCRELSVGQPPPCAN